MPGAIVEGRGEGWQRNSGPHPRLWLPASLYRLHPCSRVLLPQGEGTQGLSECALFTVLLSKCHLGQRVMALTKGHARAATFGGPASCVMARSDSDKAIPVGARYAMRLPM